MKMLSRIILMGGMIAGVGMALAFQPVAAVAAPHGFCVRYANAAMAQQRRNLRLGCGYAGPRWHFNWAAHYGWCRAMPRRRAWRERRIRGRMLRSCMIGPGPAVVRTFVRPRFGGLRLDWCKYWSRLCGRPAANAYCRYRGYRRALSFHKAVDIGRWTDTRLIGTGRICRGNFCDGFRYITCTR